jgi:hypothetical protein
MFKLPILATTLALVCLCLSVLSAHAQQYFVDDGETVQPVDNWKQTQQTDIQATGLQPANDADAAIFTILPSGAFTVLVRGASGTSAIALLEIYNLESPFRAVH